MTTKKYILKYLIDYICSGDCVPTHFEINRYAEQDMLKIIPNEWINDNHLDLWCVCFYQGEKRMGIYPTETEKPTIEINKRFEITEINKL